MDDLNNLLKQLAAARKQKHDTALAVDKWLDNKEYIALVTAKGEAAAQLAEIEGTVRKAVLEDYRANGNKKINDELGIREVTRLMYDPVEAREWCLANLPDAVVLDTKTFENYAKHVKQPAFVAVMTDITATIAADLSKYLEK